MADGSGISDTGFRTGPWVPVRRYVDISALWIRAAMSYRGSFVALLVASFLIQFIDFVAIWIFFGHVDTLGGFGLREVALIYGATGFGIGIGDLVTGSVERIGTYVRTGELDTMMTRPVPLLVQVCAHQFAIRRLSRILQAAAVLAYGASAVDWTASRVLVAVGMVASSGVIFFALFIGLACIQFWTADASEAANAFTYGGNTLAQYPLTVYPAELVKALTFLLPIAFVNWYPCLYLLGRPDPFGLPQWLQFCSPVAAGALLALALLAWRTGVRRYASTGS